jgi:hypothetical protein
MMTKHRRVILSKNDCRCPLRDMLKSIFFLRSLSIEGPLPTTLHAFSKRAEVFAWVAETSEVLPEAG